MLSDSEECTTCEQYESALQTFIMVLDEKSDELAKNEELVKQLVSEIQLKSDLLSKIQRNFSDLEKKAEIGENKVAKLAKQVRVEIEGMMEMVRNKTCIEEGEKVKERLLTEQEDKLENQKIKNEGKEEMRENLQKAQEENQKLKYECKELRSKMLEQETNILKL